MKIMEIKMRILFRCLQPLNRLKPDGGCPSVCLLSLRRIPEVYIFIKISHLLQNKTQI